MRGNVRRDTAPELAVRSAVHRLGLRFRVASRPAGLAREADLVFSRARVAVFVDGCYWHGCPKHFKQPHINSEYWRAKIEGNIRRDRDTDARLRAAGWQVVRVWEHEAAGVAAEKVADAVRTR